jgi:hypothetical protein
VAVMFCFWLQIGPDKIKVPETCTERNRYIFHKLLLALSLANDLQVFAERKGYIVRISRNFLFLKVTQQKVQQVPFTYDLPILADGIFPTSVIVSGILYDMYSSVITNTCVWVDVWKWERTQGWSKKLG